MERALLITGGAGFIGSHLAEDALDRGWRVVVLDDLSTGARENVPEGALLVERDLLEGPDLERLLRDERIDVVSHHAAQIDVRKSLEDPVEDARVNVLGSVALFDACRRAGVRRIVFASSGGAIYGNASVIPTPETHPAQPASPYGCAKRAAELYLEAMWSVGDLEPVILRYANVYGPRQGRRSEAGVISIFLGGLLSDRPVAIFGDGGQTRDFVFVGDVVRVHRRAIENLAPGTYNVGTGTETSVLALYRAAAELTGRSASPDFLPAITGEVRRSALDAVRLDRELGSRPGTPIAEGLAVTAEWVRSGQRSVPESAGD